MVRKRKEKKNIIIILVKSEKLVGSTINKYMLGEKH